MLAGFFPHAAEQRSHWPFMSGLPSTLSTSIPIGRPLTHSGVTFSAMKNPSPAVRPFVANL